MDNAKEILWDDYAIEDLKDVYDFNLEKFSIDFAVKIRTEILDTVSDIVFTKQWQYDDVLEKPYRRMVVRHYRIVYTEKSNIIRILRIFDNRQNPSKLKDSFR